MSPVRYIRRPTPPAEHESGCACQISGQISRGASMKRAAATSSVPYGMRHTQALGSLPRGRAVIKARLQAAAGAPRGPSSRRPCPQLWVGPVRRPPSAVARSGWRLGHVEYRTLHRSRTTGAAHIGARGRPRGALRPPPRRLPRLLRLPADHPNPPPCLTSSTTTTLSTTRRCALPHCACRARGGQTADRGPHRACRTRLSRRSPRRRSRSE